LADGEAAKNAWDQWRTQVDLDAVDHSSAQLLSLAYRNLARLGVRDGTHEKLKLHYMVTWAKNQKTFRLLSETLQLLHTRQIETLVLKGAALVPLYYGDEGARGMSDFDVLVPERQFHEACSVLQEARWRPLYYDPQYFDTRFEHAIAFLNEEGSSVDLHCHVLIESCERGADDSFWAASQPLEVLGTETQTLCDTDHLVQACAHGLVWVKFPPVRWVADALTILQEVEDSIQWDRLVHVAVERGIAFKILATVDYLRSTFGADIPADVSQSLGSVPASRGERRRYQTWTQNKRGRPASLLHYHWSMHNRGIGSVGPLRRFMSIPQYLRFWAQTDRLWRIPATLAVKAWRVVGRRLGLYEYWDGS